MTRPKLGLIRLGVDVPYEQAWDLQRQIHTRRVAGEISDTVLLLEHAPVYTAGKRTQPLDRPVDGTPVIDVDRGGKITWHGPGQLTAYPIVKLRDPIDVTAFVRLLEQVMIDVCAEFGVAADRAEGRAGVWVAAAPERGLPERKVGAIGLRVARGVTMHGIAVNCCNDPAWFDRIVPCGIPLPATTLTQETGRRITVDEVTPHIEKRLAAALEATAVEMYEEDVVSLT